jgi:hypothetical protein
MSALRLVAASALLAIGALTIVSLAAVPALAAEQPKLPPQVKQYFEEGLVPRLIDLYGAGDGVTKGIDFDATTAVGPVSRVLEWTPDFLAGRQTDQPVRLTNDWVAPVSVRGSVIGLATVWINPGNDLPELATFNPPSLASRLAQAPPESLLVRDRDRGAWFALDDDTLTPLVTGDSGVTEPTTPDAYQRSITGITPQQQQSAAPSGVVVAAAVLGVVIVGLVVFILVPGKRRG